MIFSSAFAKETTPPSEADVANKYIASEWRIFNHSIDSFFSNQNYLLKENQSSIMAYTSMYKKEGESIKNNFDLQMKFDLPRTTKKLKIVVEKEQNEIVNALSDENVTQKKAPTPATSNSKYTAGADYLFSESRHFTSLIKVGFRIDLPINPFAKLNLSKEIETKYVDINLSQGFMLYRQAGAQEISQLQFARKWNKDIRTEQTNSLVWTDETDMFVLRNSFSLFQSVGDEKALSYSVGANAKLSPTYYYDSYDLSVSYRQLIYSKWLYGTLTVGADFPKADHFHDEKFVQLRAEIFFR